MRLGSVSQRLDALLEQAAQEEMSFLQFTDLLLREEVGSKTDKRVRMGLQIAHFPSLESLEDFDYGAQPSVDRRYERGSILITTNQMMSQWGVTFGHEMIAAAILDRLLNHSHTRWWSRARAIGCE